MVAIQPKSIVLVLLLLGSHVASSTSSSSSTSSATSSTATSSSTSTCRDRYLWPFSNQSIWNTPIGSNAVYFPANIYANKSYPPEQIHNDEEYLILSTLSSPLSAWMDTTGTPWPDMGCQSEGPIRTYLPLPEDYVTDCYDGNNNSAGLLMPDNETLIQFQPFYRGVPGGNFSAWFDGGYYGNTSILGPGSLGSHGGSGLSGFGGSIRLGELLDASSPITHALKLELFAHDYYYYDWDTHNASSCYTWPAVDCDGYHDVPGPYGYNGTNPYLKPGSLLAVNPSIAPNVAQQMKTIPGRLILDALTDYGGYLVDDTYCNCGSFCAELGVNEEVYETYGYNISTVSPLSQWQGIPMYWDLVLIFQSLSIVINNGPNSIGGGGIPRRPYPPPICDE